MKKGDRVKAYHADTIKREAAKRVGKTKLTKKESGNVTVVTATSSSIKTVAELLDAADIDQRCLDQNADTPFVVERSKANKYDQIFGVGGKDNRTPLVVPLWQVWAELRRRKATPVEFAPVAPIKVNFSRAGVVPKPPKRDMDCALILPDSQHGFRRESSGYLNPTHDRVAIDIAFQMAGLLRPNRIVLLGDMLDLPECSDKFLHGPEFAQTTQAAGVDLAWCIAKLRSLCPDARVNYLEGNHEFRLVKLMQRNAFAACGLSPVGDLTGPPLMSIQRFLGLDDLGVEYSSPYPDGELWLNDYVRVSHGHIARSGVGDTAKTILNDARNSEIYGHLHHAEMMAKTTHPRKGQCTYYAFCPGTLARIDGAVPAATPRVNWQQGLGVVWYKEGKGLYQFVHVPIFGGIAVYDGRLLQGVDYAERLAKDTGMRSFLS